MDEFPLTKVPPLSDLPPEWIEDVVLVRDEVRELIVGRHHYRAFFDFLDDRSEAAKGAFFVRWFRHIYADASSSRIRRICDKTAHRSNSKTRSLHWLLADMEKRSAELVAPFGRDPKPAGGWMGLNGWFVDAIRADHVDPAGNRLGAELRADRDELASVCEKANEWTDWRVAHRTTATPRDVTYAEVHDQVIPALYKLTQKYLCLLTGELVDFNHIVMGGPVLPW